MRPAWLIESGVYGREVDLLLAEVRRQGMACEVIPYQALKNGAAPVVVGGETLTPDACVLGYGTYPFAQQILLHHRWVPGAWCSVENLDCATYYPYFGRHLLNQRYAILSGVEAIRQSDVLFSTFARDGRVFARPTSCHKLFVGRCVDRESFATALAPARYDPDTQVVIAVPRPIGREWRLVVVDDHVVSGSQYAAAGSRAIMPGCPAEVRSFAESLLAEVSWRPDPAFMLDVCEADGQLRLVELNSFSSSWLYACDVSVVVSEVGELVLRLWRQQNPGV